MQSKTKPDERVSKMKRSKSLVFFFFLTEKVQHTIDDVSVQDGKPNRLTRLSLLLIKSIGAWYHASAGQMSESSRQDVNVPL